MCVCVYCEMEKGVVCISNQPKVKKGPFFLSLPHMHDDARAVKCRITNARLGP